MATTGASISTTPTELIATLSLTRGSKYLIQNNSLVPMYFAEASSTPTVTSPNTIILAPGEKYGLTPPTGTEGVYCWVKSGGPADVGYVAVNPLPST